ncbi:MAG: alpha/beta fold hydrolase [Candidatus Falkowbacteria bacterium]
MQKNSRVFTMTKKAIEWLNRFLKVNVRLHGEENIPSDAPIIFVANHFTRFETFMLPWYIQRGRKDMQKIYSLAYKDLFIGKFGDYLRSLGAVSTGDPDRDTLIVRSLITKEAPWIIFPEGMMVKNKKIFNDGRLEICDDTGFRQPHTGAATLALRAEFYRRRLLGLSQKGSPEAERLLASFRIGAIEQVSKKGVVIVPLNISYYPIRARENFLNRLAERFVGEVSGRVREELMVEGEMLFGGVDIDIRFGAPIKTEEYLNNRIIRDIDSEEKIFFDDPIASRDLMKMKSRKIMLRYMKAIYGLATVNHDNIFASILWHTRGTEIEEKDLLRIAYLLTVKEFKETRTYWHQDLSANQLSLVTDDRYGHYRDFLDLATEKGVVVKRGGTLVINKDRLSCGDFHSVRIDNPLIPIQNEIEPLVFLQKRIEELTGVTSRTLRVMTREHLQNKAVVGFNNDYDAFFNEKDFKKGEIKDREVGRPRLLIPGKLEDTDFKDRIGVVLAHGYLAAPFEVKHLAQYLLNKGLWVYIPRLKGHGTSPKDLINVKHEDWIDAVDEGYVLLSNYCDRVVLGGFSAGAGMILDLASRAKDIEGVFAVCPPLKLKSKGSTLAPAVCTWNDFVHWEGIKWKYVANNPENPHINYKHNPIAGVRELGRLMDRVEHALPKISVPALVIQSLEDPVVDYRGTMRLYLRLASEKKKYSIFRFKRHGIVNGNDVDCVFRDIWDFIKHLVN